MRVQMPDLFTNGGNKVDRPVEVHLRQGEIESVMAKSHLKEVKEFDITAMLTGESREKILAHLKEKEMQERKQRPLRLTINTLDRQSFSNCTMSCEFTPVSDRNANPIVHSLKYYGTDLWPVADSGSRMKVLELLGSNPE